jgi:hypothetical protein
MERVRAALAAIQKDRGCAVEVLERGLREAPEVFIPGIACFVATALEGVVLRPENLPNDP